MAAAAIWRRCGGTRDQCFDKSPHNRIIDHGTTARPFEVIGADFRQTVKLCSGIIRPTRSAVDGWQWVRRMHSLHSLIPATNWHGALLATMFSRA
jgi:hypothetical protein